jgi:hypothetical protein
VKVTQTLSHKAVYHQVLRENEEQVGAITSQPPLSVERRDGQRIERFQMALSKSQRRVHRLPLNDLSVLD